MDLYQIFIEHNRPWSSFEIICYFIMLILLFFVYIFLYKCGKVNRVQIIAGLLLFTYYCIVLESTVFTRKNQGYHAYELEVFWSWKDVIFYHSREMLKENLLNIALLLPFGLLLPFPFYKRLRWWQGLAMGLIASAVIEVLQLVLCRGLFEFDDMIHNGFGCMLGSMLAGLLFQKLINSNLQTEEKMKILGEKIWENILELTASVGKQM